MVSKDTTDVALFDVDSFSSFAALNIKVRLNKLISLDKSAFGLTLQMVIIRIFLSIKSRCFQSYFSLFAPCY